MLCISSSEARDYAAAMAEQPIPPDRYSPADRGLWHLKLELAKEQAAAFMAKKIAELKPQGKSAERKP
jgi:hypothetical protein